MNKASLEKDILDLEAKENELDLLIREVNLSLKYLQECDECRYPFIVVYLLQFFMMYLLVLTLTVLTYAYVTYQDIQKIQSFRDQTVIAIKAPKETKLEVPNPKDVSGFLIAWFGLSA